MDHLQIGTLITNHAHPVEALSARPDAPVVPHVERPATAAATRTRVAGALHRLADAVAPAGGQHPARRHAYAGGRAR